jgi:hypothetical protein
MIFTVVFFSFSETARVMNLNSRDITLHLSMICFFFHFQRLCPSYELEFKGHHSTSINNMIFTVFFFSFSETMPEL